MKEKNLHPEELQKAIQQEAKNRASEMLTGVLRYYQTPYKRIVAEPPVIWQRGNTRLLDYGSKIKNPKSVVLFIPSLINRYYILDLEEERSFLRYLATQDIYPLVLDWGIPGDFEKDFGCAGYITEILAPAIDFIAGISAKPIALAGYCMGGVLALAAANIKRTKISSLALFATPWNFHCPEFLPFILDRKWKIKLGENIAAQQTLSADVIQSLFYLTDPFIFENKFRRYADFDQDSCTAKDFVALEHWVNDGVPMTSAVAHDCLINWVQENRLLSGTWKVGKKKIAPPPSSLPTFIAIPKNDHIVPFDCAMPLATASSHAHIIHPGSGHVGMIVGSHAHSELWQPYTTWLGNIEGFAN